jgi:hypothetical protein
MGDEEVELPGGAGGRSAARMRERHTRGSGRAAARDERATQLSGRAAWIEQLNAVLSEHEVKGTKKTKKRSRTPDIEPNLLPLVAWLVKHPQGKANRRLRVPPAEDYAEKLRQDLGTVGARADRLHTSDSTRTKMTGHDLRDTGLTHMAVRGDHAVAIPWCAGTPTSRRPRATSGQGRSSPHRCSAAAAAARIPGRTDARSTPR